MVIWSDKKLPKTVVGHSLSEAPTKKLEKLGDMYKLLKNVLCVQKMKFETFSKSKIDESFFWSLKLTGN